MNTNLGAAYENAARQGQDAQRLGPMSSTFAQILITLLISIAVCYLSPLLPIWPESTKRALWETLVFLTPSQVVYAMDHFPARLLRRTNNNDADVTRFQRSDFGNNVAKSEALRRLFRLDGNSTFIPAVGRARAFSGLGTFFGGGRSDMPAGLGNWDNSCYQNSVLQGLASLHTLKSFVDANLEYCDTCGIMPSHQALQAISSKLNDQNNNGKSLWTPPALKSMSSWQQQDAQEYFSKIMDEIEKEARKVQQTLQKIPSLAKPLQTDGSEESIINVAVGSQKNKEQLNSNIARHMPSSPMEGLLAQRVGCTQCGYSEGLSLIPFTVLTLPLGRNFLYDIRDCLDEYTAFETIEGVECSKCTVLMAKAQLEKLIAHNESFLKTKGDQEDQQDPQTLSVIQAAQIRLHAVKTALAECDFSDSTLSKKLKLNNKNRATIVKSRQAVIARPPRSLVLHVNRSVFDEMTGAQFKNTASVRFPLQLDLSYWSLGHSSEDGTDDTEVWETAPSKPMLPAEPHSLRKASPYVLRAVITHQGHHENGHYVAFRKRPWRLPDFSEHDDEGNSCKLPQYEDRWFRFSDESVSQATEGQVLSQGGVFMLFYERLDADSSVQETLADKAAQVPQVNPESRESAQVNGALITGEDVAEIEIPKGMLDREAFSVTQAHPHLPNEDVSTASSVVDDSSNFSQSEVASDSGGGSDISSVGTPNGLSKLTQIQLKHDEKNDISASGYPSPPLSTC